MDVHDPPLVGLLPAAGRASRLAPLPLSKELLPVGFARAREGQEHPKVVSHYLLEQYREAGVRTVYWVLREGKWDIPAYYGSGAGLGLELAYLLAKNAYGVPDTLDSAYGFVRGARVALGFPDILYPAGVFARAARAAPAADLLLGLFPALAPERSDMVALDQSGRVLDIVVKPPETTLTESWGLAFWSPRFSAFLHDWLSQQETPPEGERHLSEAFLAALRAGLTVASISFQEPFLDLGVPEGYRAALAKEVG